MYRKGERGLDESYLLQTASGVRIPVIKNAIKMPFCLSIYLRVASSSEDRILTTYLRQCVNRGADSSAAIHGKPFGLFALFSSHYTFTAPVI